MPVHDKEFYFTLESKTTSNVDGKYDKYCALTDGVQTGKKSYQTTKK